MQNRFKFLLILSLSLFGSSKNIMAMSEAHLAVLITESDCVSPAVLASLSILAKADRIVLGKQLVNLLLLEYEYGAMSVKKNTDRRTVSSLIINLSEKATEAYLAASRADIIAVRAESMAEQARNNIHSKVGNADERRFAILASLTKSREATQAREAAKVADAYWQISASTLPKRMASAVFDYRFKVATNAATSIQAVMREYKVRPGKAERLEAYRSVVRARRSATDTGAVDTR